MRLVTDHLGPNKKARLDFVNSFVEVDVSSKKHSSKLILNQLQYTVLVELGLHRKRRPRVDSQVADRVPR